MREKGRANDDVRDYVIALAGRRGVSRREAEVARLVAFGYTNAEVCEELNVSLSTVKAHVARLFLKLGVHTRGILIGEVRRIVSGVQRDGGRSRRAQMRERDGDERTART